jgi:hypothetical protein
VTHRCRSRSPPYAACQSPCTQHRRTPVTQGKQEQRRV